MRATSTRDRASAAYLRDAPLSPSRTYSASDLAQYTFDIDHLGGHNDDSPLEKSWLEKQNSVFGLEMPSGNLVYTIVFSTPLIDTSAASFLTTPDRNMRKATRRSTQDLILLAATALAAEPLDDGQLHPGETITRRLITDHAVEFLETLKELGRDSNKDELVADLIRLAARADLDSSIADLLLSLALDHPSPLVRDAGVAAVEDVLDDHSAARLRTHREATPWIRTYIERVLAAYDAD